MSNYNFQTTTAAQLIEMTISNKHYANVLAAAPGAGKSTIIIHAINMILEQFPTLRVVILTHNLNLLKKQMLDGLEDGHVEPKFTYGEFSSQAQVVVGIPSSRQHIQACDLLVVDEAHQYYNAKMVQEIREKFQPKFEILMTGTPGVFHQQNDEMGYEHYGFITLSGEEMANQGVYSDVVVDVAEAGSDVISTYLNAFEKAKADSRFDDRKIMIACKSVADAYVLGTFLRENGRKIAISTAENDKSNIQIANFTSGTADTLIVVNKGILGFSDSSMTALFDLKCSSDVEARLQLIARIFRIHPENVKKFYISAVPRKKMNQEIQTLQDTMKLMNTEVFAKYWV